MVFEEHLLHKLIDLQCGSKYSSVFYIDTGSNDYLITNDSILPQIYRGNDCTLMQKMHDNQIGIKFEDRAVFEFVYAQIANEYNLLHHRGRELSVILRLNNGGADEAYDTFELRIEVFENKSGHSILGFLQKQEICNNVETTMSVFEDYVQRHIDETCINALIQFDIAGFKGLNEQMGEDYGDALLDFMTNCLKILLGTEARFIRCVADVFTIFYKCSSEQQVTENIREWERIIGNFNDLSVRLVWGVYIIRDATIPVKEMVSGVALARHSVKGTFIDNIGYYGDKLKRDTDYVTAVEFCMKQALDNGEFKLFVQPKYNMNSGHVVGGEVLVRWRHNGEIVSPADFIPIFEKDGFIIQLDRFVWRETCRFLSKQKIKLPLSVNVSRRHFDTPEFKFIDYLDELVDKYDINKKDLQLEITETVDSPNVEAGLQELKDRGYILLMDDFGAGYSSLISLRNTIFDIIKIDKGFLASLMDDKAGRIILANMIATIMGIKAGIIIEGVETPEQVEFLRSTGCEIVQGYLYSKPMEIEKYEILLKQCVYAE